ncbi:uncharacterized protein LOC126833051 [Adelges cooleyi]|uniref:uncharacterized protein LOC126833051 n=1 Tax=Adelges cooleyi TaxID=133065 RepID=UPI00217FFEB6|nr:uncharacterized protein LOC126833051 [Adelges cooleyi]
MLFNSTILFTCTLFVSCFNSDEEDQAISDAFSYAKFKYASNDDVTSISLSDFLEFLGSLDKAIVNYYFEENQIAQSQQENINEELFVALMKRISRKRGVNAKKLADKTIRAFLPTIILF